MRLDEFLFKNNFYNSRTKSKESILKGYVFVDNKCVTKPSFDVSSINIVETKNNKVEFVSNGGYKLEKALKDFSFNVVDLIVADIGASTGGFTDCLLKNGAKKVFSVDLNDDLLDERLKKDSRVKRIIKNARHLTLNDFSDKLDLIVGDLSFISLDLILPVLFNLLEDNRPILFLIKPQFECDEKIKFKNGIINDKKYRVNACKKIYDSAIKNGFTVNGLTNAPIIKGKNIEYLIYLNKNAGKSVDFEKLNIV